MIDFFITLGASFSCVTGLMIIAWVYYLFSRNAGIVDLVWAVGFVITLSIILYFGEGYFWKKLVFIIMGMLWSVRLAAHLFQRYVKYPEDPRYADLREKLGKENSDLKFLGFFLLEGLSIILLSTPFYLVSINTSDLWTTLEICSIVLFVLAFAGETTADFQLAEFRAKPENSGKVCQDGWWFFSRHPNYFFESLIWISFGLFAFSSPWGYLALLAPVLMIYLLLFISGIPATEEHMVKSRGDQYREYQRTTSSFIPWIKKV